MFNCNYYFWMVLALWIADDSSDLSNFSLPNFPFICKCKVFYKVDNTYTWRKAFFLVSVIVVSFEQPSYSVNEDVPAQPVLIFSNVSETDITLQVTNTVGSATGEYVLQYSLITFVLNSRDKQKSNAWAWKQLAI